MSERDAEPTVVHTPPASTTGRLAVLTGFSLAASAIPIPFLPDRVVFQIRGAIAQDVAARHGLSLTTDARTALAHTSSDSPVRNMIRRGIGVLSKTILKRLGPLAALSTAATALEVYALGLLLEHYIVEHRPRGTLRFTAEEAREVRDRIDRSIVRAISPALNPAPVPLLPPTEDLRDEFTRWIDTAILLGAGLPSYIERRLISAFDDLGHISEP